MASAASAAAKNGAIIMKKIRENLGRALSSAHMRE
jgi:hypothetical protein